jgi:hypothetical protein
MEGGSGKMKKFNYSRPEDLKNATAMLKAPGKVQALAGGTDLLGTLKDKILPVPPDELVSLKRLGLNYIKEEENKIIKNKAKNNINWEYNHEIFQDEPWRMCKYEPSTNIIYLNNRHPAYLEIEQNNSEYFKNVQKREFIFMLLTKELVMHNLGNDSLPLRSEIEKDMDVYVKFLLKTIVRVITYRPGAN